MLGGDNMKKTLMILGGIFSVLIILGVVGFIIMAIIGTGLDKESKAYVDDVTPKILSNLNKETLFKYSSDELKNSATSEEIDKIFSFFEKLGKFKEYKGSKGQSYTNIDLVKGKQILGYYTAQADFESEPATISITAIKKDNGWQILNFHINSMALANK